MIRYFFFLFLFTRNANMLDEVGKRMTTGERRWGIIEGGTFARGH
jgi:hypothetical protein